MTAANATISAPRPARSLWWKLKVAAILVLILGNVLYFGGNAALDLWQVAGPGTSFNGTIVDHKHVVTTGENGDEFNVLVIDSNRGELRLDVSDRTFNDTDVGQHLSGVLDARGLFGHDEALRSLRVDGRAEEDANVTNRIVGQTFILLVVTGVGGLALSLMWRGLRPAAPAPPARTPEASAREA